MRLTAKFHVVNEKDDVLPGFFILPVMSRQVIARILGDPPLESLAVKYEYRCGNHAANGSACLTKHGSDLYPILYKTCPDPSPLPALTLNVFISYQTPDTSPGVRQRPTSVAPLLRIHRRCRPNRQRTSNTSFPSHARAGPRHDAVPGPLHHPGIGGPAGSSTPTAGRFSRLPGRRRHPPAPRSPPPAGGGIEIGPAVPCGDPAGAAVDGPVEVGDGPRRGRQGERESDAGAGERACERCGGRDSRG